MTETHLLLRDYAQNGSETAFRTLVGHYVDLVYSTALRRFDGDSHRAEDVAQMVFVDLAKKARTLPDDVMLGGWLHRHCCFLANNMKRGEWRRAAREREAVAMETVHGQEPAWSEVAGELDEAIEKLEADDRDAIVLRFFERKDFKAIGEAIGATENAAQKRVARALEKLRPLLMERGVTFSMAGLAAALAAQAIASAPKTLAANAASHALKRSGAKASAGAAASAGGGMAIWWICAGAAILVGLILALRFAQTASEETGQAGNAKAQSMVADVRPAGDGGRKAALPAVEPTPSVEAVSSLEGGPVLRLTILADDNGAVVPNVPIEYRSTEGKKWEYKDLQSSALGVAKIPYTSNTTELRLITRTEGFADTRLFFQPKIGDAIPGEYTLRLKRGVKIGGKIVNSRGDLVAGAVIDFNMPMPDPQLAQKRESHEIEAIHITAEDGNWQSWRIPESLLKRGHMDASHPDYNGSEASQFPLNSTSLELLLQGKHVFRLRDGVTVRGLVLDQNGRPIPNAKIRVGAISFTDTRVGAADAEGRFEIAGCTPGVTMVTASAKGFGAKTLRVDPPLLEEGYRLVLEPGRSLKLRVANRAGEPIAKANVWLKTIDTAYLDSTNTLPLTQAEFSPRTDAEGRAKWSEAPAAELTLDIEAKGYLRRSEAKVAADGIEHTVTLLPELRISGTVRDAVTGLPIPKFQMIAGYPSKNHLPGATQPSYLWSTMADHMAVFSDGKFSHAYSSPVAFGVETNRYAFKIEADGYKPFITRIVEEDEGNVVFDVQLQPGAIAKLTLLDDKGKPAPDVDVALLNLREQVILMGRGLDRRIGRNVLSSDAKGQVGFNGADIAKVVAAGAAGFAMVNAADIRADGVIALQPWSRVQGKVTRHGKPIRDWDLQLRTDYEKAGIFLNAGSAKTDEEGMFTINNAPPGLLSLMRQAQLTRPGSSGAGQPISHASFELKEIEIPAGVTFRVDYDDPGVKVEIRLRWPAGFQLSPQSRVFCQASIPNTQPSQEEMKDPEAMAKWRNRPDIKAAIKKMAHGRFAEIKPDLWACDGLPPGEWTIGATIINENAAPGQPPAVALRGSIKVRIPEDSTAENLDLGEIVLTKPALP